MYFKFKREGKSQKQKIEKHKDQTNVNVKAIKKLQAITRGFLARKNLAFKRMTTLDNNERKYCIIIINRLSVW
jgi:hypothetical protein